MDNETFAALCRELENIIDCGPGANSAALSSAKAALFKIRHDPDANAYVREKVPETEGDFDVWFSARRWNKHGDTKAKGVKSTFSLLGLFRGSIPFCLPRRRDVPFAEALGSSGCAA